MSTPIRHADLALDDPHFYAQSKWSKSEFNALLFQPSATAVKVQNFRPTADPASHDDVSLARTLLDSRERSGVFKCNRVRIAALAGAAIAVLWTMFCISVGLERFKQNEPMSAKTPEVSVSERLEEASAALHKASRQILAPTIVVADTSGAVNAALPLGIKITNYTAETTISLSGLVGGTILSTGADAGDGQWRVAIDDLPNTRVIPPHEYVGSMTIVVELRASDDQPIVRTPLRLTWQPVVAVSTEAVGGPSSTSSPPVAGTMATKQVLLQQSPTDSAVIHAEQPGAPKHTSNAMKASSLKNRRAAKRHRRGQQLSDPELFADADVPRQRQQWDADLQNIIDRSWERCRRIFDCDMDRHR